ncbi:hypothetical protein NNJEOMEG_00473 [Fundidesulfovibrio magnetotacticus]|uniref:Antitoxin FitA-like ribbon-helix-helix domain-containing protein n=1 Tax=Fundidesulfovibrio magnetotacticus TaxID=2730080 RepID=A0A6V8LQN5_9BACT|nr:hypothetical protein [Fundidesulfovibrio magnetotacticus]GFK92648.1 hypothetical protein NNJEOMEG_00473 [Fundidesulfovibrio magnetotacticus]
MAQLIVRNLDEDLVRLLKQRAAAKGVSVESEHRRILEEALRPGADDFWDMARRLQESSRPQKTDSAELIRQERDRRAGFVK